MSRRREPHRRDPGQRSAELAARAFDALSARGLVVALERLEQRPFQDLIDAINWALLGRGRAMMPPWLRQLVTGANP